MYLQEVEKHLELFNANLIFKVKKLWEENKFSKGMRFKNRNPWRVLIKDESLIKW